MKLNQCALIATISLTTSAAEPDAANLRKQFSPRDVPVATRSTADKEGPALARILLARQMPGTIAGLPVFIVVAIPRLTGM